MAKTSHQISKLLQVGLPAQSKFPTNSDFTLREREIIQGISADMNAKMIALSLDISVFTVQDHIKNIKRKMAVHTSGGIVAHAFRLGLIE